MSKQPPPAPSASAEGPCPTVIQIVERPGTGSLPSTIAPPDHPFKYIDARRSQELNVDNNERIQNKNNYFAFMLLVTQSFYTRTILPNEELRRKIQAATGEYDELLTLVKK